MELQQPYERYLDQARLCDQPGFRFGRRACGRQSLTRWRRARVRHPRRHHCASDRKGEAVGPGRPVGLGQVHAADGDGGARARRYRLGHRWRANWYIGRSRRGSACALSRPPKSASCFQSFHLIPTMTALENVAVPLGARRRGRRVRARRAASSRRSASPSACRTIRRSSPAASSSASRSPARSRHIPPSWWPTSRPAISTRRPGARSTT